MAAGVVTVLGENVADAFPDASGPRSDGALTLRVHPGGSPANTAVALARLGTRTRFMGRIADDVFGRAFRERLAASSVDLTRSVRAVEPSTLAVATLDSGGRAAYSFHAEATADWQWTPEELPPDALDSSVCLHTGSIALGRTPGGRVIEEFAAAARRRVTVSIDPNVRLPLVSLDDLRARMPRWCAIADVLKLSEDDLALLYPGMSIERACDEWHAAGVTLVVVTKGAQGAVASLRGGRVVVPGFPVAVVDTVGAGDAFTAGLLHALGQDGLLGGRLPGLSIEQVREAVGFAARVAALTCSVAGANPPWGDRLPMG
ncbi:carbohydrate kinase [Spongiactinospora sp. TRM90649]|uniref:carbohydrate kinase family protein n=1 Tax=Spongiactinospora sp. TRM90649 TaxID=3031114 RepID=UPI0023F9D5F4|nr:carbohydrate kinase [Spongiactinospora sp. TRM90649]MDF5756024.1 carbohydrate kinase [Spongiactinospora sp. TRM90649]